MDLFLIGHGFMHYSDKTPSFTVPKNLTLRFYRKEDTYFDSAWEADIMAKKVDSKYKPIRAGQDFELKEYAGGSTVKEHLLTAPGGITSTRKLGEIKDIQRFKNLPQEEVKKLNGGGLIDVDVAHGCLVRGQLVDNDVLCIKSGLKMWGQKVDNSSKSTARLSHILRAISQSIKEPAVVHWCACPEPGPQGRPGDDQVAGQGLVQVPGRLRRPGPPRSDARAAAPGSGSARRRRRRRRPRAPGAWRRSRPCRQRRWRRHGPSSCRAARRGRR